MPERDELLAAIEKIEKQRLVLGDTTVDAAVAGLWERLTALGTERRKGGADEAERKHVTIFFADLSGFTPLSARLDPEELRSLTNQCFDCLGQVITRYGGYIDKFVGDEMMVLFGAPIAMEDHASRALSAALAVREALAGFNQTQSALKSETLDLHFGINSGIVVAGGAGSESKREYTVIGEAVNIAARLVSVAKPGEIIVGEATERLLGQGFDLEDVGPVALKGVTGGVRVYRLADAQESEYTIRPQRFAVDMVGRQQEMSDLQSAFTTVLATNTPRCVSLIGPAGVGKSRLYEEFRGWAQSQHPSTNVLYGAAFPHMSSTPYFMMGDMVRRWLGVNEAASEPVDRARLGARLAELGLGETRSADALARVLGLGSNDDSMAALEPDERKRRVFEGFVAFVRAAASGGPLILVCEDLHWADDLSVELMEHLFANLEASPIFFLVMTRPVLDPGSKLRQAEPRIPEHLYKRLVLAELDDESCSELVLALVPSLARSPETVQAIVQKGQGNPFFVEEVVASLRDRGVDFELQSAAEVARLTVPDTVFALLAERIDRLPQSQKRVLQSAAVVGRVFWPTLVSELAEMEPTTQLDALNRRELIHPVRPAELGDGWEWMFRHVLLQEVAYSGLLKERRRLLHRVAAHWLETRVVNRSSEYAPLLAHHYELGEDWAKTAEWANVAGDWAAALFAYNEATQYYSKAVSALRQLPATDEVKREFVETTVKLANASSYTPTQDVYDNLEAAAVFAADLSDKQAELRVLAGKAHWLYMTGRGPEAVGAAMQCISSAGGAQDFLVAPYGIVGRAMGMMGEWQRCREMLERSIQLATEFAVPVAERPGLGFLGIACMQLGDWERGRALTLEGLQIAERTGNARQIGAAHMFIGGANSVDISDDIQASLEQAVAIQEQIEDYSALYVSLAGLGHVHAMNGNLLMGKELLSRAIAMADDMNVVLFVPVHRAYLAEVYIREGDAAKAVEVARHGVEQAVASRQQACEGEARRALGWALYYSGAAPDEAERELRFPVDTYKRLGAVVLGAQAGFELATFLDLTDRAEEAAAVRAEASEAVDRFRLGWIPRPAPAPGQ